MTFYLYLKEFNNLAASYDRNIRIDLTSNLQIFPKLQLPLLASKEFEFNELSSSSLVNASSNIKNSLKIVEFPIEVDHSLKVVSIDENVQSENVTEETQQDDDVNEGPCPTQPTTTPYSKTTPKFPHKQPRKPSRNNSKQRHA